MSLKMNFNITVIHGNNFYHLNYECKSITYQEGFYNLQEVKVFSADGRLHYTREEVYVPIALSVVEKI